MIKLTIDEVKYRDAQKALRSLRKELPRAAVSALQKTVTRTVQILTDATADVLNLKKGRIKEDISVEIRGAEITDDNALAKFSGVVRSSGEPIGLVNFATNADTWTQGRDISIKIFRRKGGIVRFRHAFIAKGRGASISQRTGDLKVHMWQRAGKRSHARYRPGLAYAKLPHDVRFPIERLTTSRIQDIQAQPDLIGQVLHDVGEDALKGVAEEMDVVFHQG